MKMVQILIKNWDLLGLKGGIKKNPNPRKKKKVPEEIPAGEAAIDKGFKILEEIRRIDMLAN